MFQLKPVGAIAHIQVCGTTSCMICGAEDLVAVCKDKIAPKAHQLSADGNFSWEEVECLGACANAPMAQIGKDYYEDLTAARMGEIIDEMAVGRVPVPGPQNGRFASEPLSGLTSLTGYDSGKTQYNASVQAAVDLSDTIKRIEGTEVPLLTPWLSTNKGKKPANKPAKPAPRGKTAAQADEARAAKSKSKTKDKTDAKPAAKLDESATTATEKKPNTRKAPRASGADDLKLISGVGPKLEGVLNELGFWHFNQIAKWGAAEVAWVDARLKFKGRIERDGWIKQAKKLAKE
jgi:NADH-quinone oxidoreductase subunit E